MNDLNVEQNVGEAPGASIVNIVIDGRTHPVHRGHTKVAALKELGGVPLAYELEEVVSGQLKVLPDDGAVSIKGGEEFISHPRDSASS